MMTKTEIKQEAQNLILMYGQIAWNQVNDDIDYIEEFTEDPDEKIQLLANKTSLLIEMDKQFQRIEKLFGFEGGTWARGA